MKLFFDKTLSFIKGRICLTVKNGFYGVFIAECKKQKIPLYDMTEKDGILYAQTDLKGLKKLDCAAEKAGVDINIEKKSGIPFIIKKYKSRYGIPAGLFLFLIIFLYFSSVLWSVEINGAEKSDAYRVGKTVEECGFVRGTPLKELNKDELKDRLYLLSPYIQRVSVSIVGNRAYVEIFEREKTEDEKNDFLYSDIAAAKNGKIIKADIFQGKGLIEDGQDVKKGDILVTGEILMKNNETRYTESKARITAVTINEVTVTSAKEINAISLKKEKNSYSLCFFGLTVPLTQGASGDMESKNEYMLTSSVTVFPVGIERKTAITARRETVALSDNEAFLLCSADFAQIVHDKYKDRNITEIRRKLSDGASFVIESQIICEEDICEPKPHLTTPE